MLKEQGVPRQDVFITSKVSPYEQGTEKATLACQQILHRLQTDYVVSTLAARLPPHAPHAQRRKASAAMRTCGAQQPAVRASHGANSCCWVFTLYMD